MILLTVFVWIVGAILVLVLGFLIFWKLVFLRDPDINIPKGKVVVAPASGTIIKIVDLDNVDSLEIKKGLMGRIKTLCSDVGKSCYLISIYMSPFDVHIQRASLPGKVISVVHKKGTLRFTGSFINGITNEKTETLINNNEVGNLKIIQIAGCVVKRIDNWLKPGQIVEKGERIGIINYGSQVSLIIPKKKLRVIVKEGQHVDSGKTIVARLV